MHSRLLVSGLLRSLPPLPPSPAPPCLPCVEERQRAAPHSSSFPPTTAPLQTLHMDVWGAARVSGQGREHYFLLVVDDYTRYTTVFPLRSKGEVPDVLIPWIRTVRLQLCERFRQDLPVLCLHSDRGGEFSSDLLRDFCRWEGILQSFTLPASPQQNGIAERRIGIVMEVARTSMIHAAAPHFLWPFAVRYAAHQLNLWPRVSLPETLPTLRWTGEVGDASVFWVWGSRDFVRDTSADKLSARAIPCIFLGFVPDVPGLQFYHPTSRHVLPSQDVTFDELVPIYRLYPYCSAPPPSPPLFLTPGPPPVAVGSGAARGPASGGVEPGGVECEGAESRGAEPGGEEPGGVEPKSVEPGGAEPEGVEPGGAELEGVESGGAEPRGAASSGGPAGASPQLSLQQLREWLVRRACLRSGAAGAGGAGDAGAGGAGVTVEAAGPKGARTRGAGAVDPRAGGAGGTVQPRPYFIPLLQQPSLAFKARYVARGFSQRQGVDYFQTFSPTPKMTSLRVLLHVAAQRDYELHSLDFSTAFLQGSLHEEIWLRRPPGFTGSFPAGTQWSLRQPVYGLCQAPREWHDTLRTTLAALGFAPSTADPSLFLRTDTLLLPFYVLVYVDDLVFATADIEALTLVKSELQKRHTCTDLGPSALRLPVLLATAHSSVYQPLALSSPSDESVEPSGPYPELVGCLMYLMTCTRPDLAYPLSLLARYVAPGRHRKVHWDAVKRVLHYLCSTSGMGLMLGGRGPVILTGHADASWVDDSATERLSHGYTFSLGSGSVSWRSTRSSSVLSSSCEAEIFAGAMASQELHWLTYLLTDLGDLPRLPPVRYVDNEAMIALCLEHRLEYRTKHIALRYFLARELHQRGQLRLAYMATKANTAIVFT
ncbi:unnamed protein product [Closterium sp. NIES-54]